MGSRIDLTGHTYGRLHVIMLSSQRIIRGKKSLAQWVCRCECGKDPVVLIETDTMRQGHTRSCGCLAWETGRKHGMWNSLTYKSWSAMRDRCSNSNNKSYPYYGGRGITVCARWNNLEDGFQNFLSDMGGRGAKEMTIDRIDSDKGYFPENCQWLDKKSQIRKQKYKPRGVSKFRGVSYRESRDKWRASIYAGKAYDLGEFKTEIDAVNAYDNKARKLGWEEDWLNFPYYGFDPKKFIEEDEL